MGISFEAVNLCFRKSFCGWYLLKCRVNVFAMLIDPSLFKSQLLWRVICDLISLKVKILSLGTQSLCENKD
uniref:Uncharacterized protein n=1 Tax=Rhizophora mucronata TaxID=61149 RepID=A0A2P2QN24_RHIMU